MKLLILLLALSGCATVPNAGTQLCVVQPLGTQEGLPIIRLYCEPDGVKV